MNCANHPESPVSAYCRSCGKPLCTECRRDVNGTIYCAEHLPAAGEQATAFANSGIPPVPPPPNSAPLGSGVGSGAGSSYTSGTASGTSGQTGSPYTSPYGAPPPSGPYVPGTRGGPSPGLAFVLGFIPGVGAIYNGQYAKGLVHAVVFGLFISLLSSGRAGNYQPLVGILLSIWIFYMAFEAYHTARKRRDGLPIEELSSLMQMPNGAGKLPIGPIVLIGLGVLFLMDTLHLLAFDEVLRYWPVGLILGGVYMLYVRIEGRVPTHGEGGPQ